MYVYVYKLEVSIEDSFADFLHMCTLSHQILDFIFDYYSRVSHGTWIPWRLSRECTKYVNTVVCMHVICDQIRFLIQNIPPIYHLYRRVFINLYFISDTSRRLWIVWITRTPDHTVPDTKFLISRVFFYVASVKSNIFKSKNIEILLNFHRDDD